MVSVKVRNHRNAPEREEPFLLSGRPVGSSLVFDPVDVKDYNDAKRQENAFHKLKVGKILKDLGATVHERSITNTIMLQELFPQERTEEPEAYMERLAPLMRKLKKLARTTLQAYKHGEGDDMRWYLPGKE